MRFAGWTSVLRQQTGEPWDETIHSRWNISRQATRCSVGDEFDETTLDSSRFGYEIGTGIRNGEA
jgi:hypothetical protein